MTLSRHIVLASSLFAVATLSSCISKEMSLRASAKPQFCNSDGDCSSVRGETCVLVDSKGDDKRGICILPGSMSVKQVYLEIQPVDQAVSIQQGPFALDSQNLPLQVPMPLDVSGAVQDEANPSLLIPQAAVHFRSVPLIPGRAQNFDVTTNNDSPEQAGRFVRRLPQGTYTITIQPPDNGGLPAPPQRIQNIRIDDGTGPLSLPVANPNYLVYPKGVLTTAKGQQEMPLAGIGVRAVELGRTGDVYANATVISRTVTTEASGAFQLGLLPLPSGNDGALFRLQVGPFLANTLFPTFLDLPLQVENRPNDTPPSTVFTLSALQMPGDLTTVRGNVIDSNGKPISGAQVIFVTSSTARTDSGRFSFTNTTTSKSDGTFEIQLYPTDYTAIAQPPMDPTGDQPTNVGLCGVTSTGAGVPWHVDGTGQMAQPVLACEQQRWIDGFVINGQGGLIADATVEAFRRPTPEFPNGMKFQTTSLSDGSFSIPVVTGTYDVLIRPPDALKLPYLWQRNIGVGALEDNFTLPSQLVDPFELFGQIVDESSGQPVQATIDAFALAEDNTAIRIGRGSSNASGQYRIVLPASQPETTLRRPTGVR